MATQSPKSIVPLQMPAVLSYAAFQRSIVVPAKGVYPIQLDPRGVAIESTTEYMYVTDVMNRLVHIFSLTGDYINHFGDPHLLCPWGILVHQDSIYVTDGRRHAIFLFRLPDLKMVKKVGKRGFGREEFSYPKGLAISPNQHLYVADMDNHSIQILTADLEFKYRLRYRFMKSPMDVKFSENEIFVLCGIDFPCVQVFTLSGEKTRSFLTTSSMGMQVRRYPQYFCLDEHNNILISHYPGRDVEVFSQKGNFLQRKHKRGMFDSPRGIAIVNNNKLICIDNRFCINILICTNKRYS